MKKPQFLSFIYKTIILALVGYGLTAMVMVFFSTDDSGDLKFWAKGFLPLFCVLVSWIPNILYKRQFKHDELDAGLILLSVSAILITIVTYFGIYFIDYIEIVLIPIFFTTVVGIPHFLGNMFYKLFK